MFARIFQNKALKTAAETLFRHATDAARDKSLYLEAGAPDTPTGRFELYTLHVGLLVIRLQREGELGAKLAQAVLESYIASLDETLREQGVGDLSVPKKIKALAKAVLGRIRSLQAALQNPMPQTEVEALLTRTLFAASLEQDPSMLAAALVQRSRNLSTSPFEDIQVGRISFLTEMPG